MARIWTSILPSWHPHHGLSEKRIRAGVYSFPRRSSPGVPEPHFLCKCVQIMSSQLLFGMHYLNFKKNLLFIFQVFKGPKDLFFTNLYYTKTHPDSSSESRISLCNDRYTRLNEASHLTEANNSVNDYQKTRQINMFPIVFPKRS